MGSNGAFAIGQLNAADTIDYDIVPPLLGADGTRHTPLSTNGYVMSATTEHPDEAWALIAGARRLGLPGRDVGRGRGTPCRRAGRPRRRSSTTATRRPTSRPSSTAMEVGVVFRPNTANAGAAFGATLDLFTRMNTGELAIADALAQIEAAANEALAPDREQ